MTTFANRVAIVTGGGSGIGRATVLAFAERGTQVVVADINETAAESVADEVRSAGGEALAVHADVSIAADTRRMIAAAVQQFGGIDIAVHSAGIGGVDAPTAEYQEDVWRQVLDVNLTGVFLCMKAVIPALLERGGGAIVNVASIAGVTGLPLATSYSAAKHGVVGLTRSAAVEYACRGIRINAICPGYIRTPMTLNAFSEEEVESLARQAPVRRWGLPEEVAAAILYMSSDAASFMIGQTLVLDGGITLPVPDV